MLLVLALLLMVAAVQIKVLDIYKPIQEKYDCSFCQPEQIHLAFGGIYPQIKYLVHITTQPNNV